MEYVAGMVRVWLDTDIGSDVDDAVALLCAIRHPEIELVGVSTVFEWVTARAWLAKEMLKRAGLGQAPVLPGATTPVGGEPRTVAPGSYGLLAPQGPPDDPGEDEARVLAIAREMESVEGAFHLLTVGALTNAALLLQLRPGIAAKWSGVTCMAGRLEGEAEWNVSCDPEGARSAFAELSPRLVGLEASSDTLAREEVEALLDPRDAASAFLRDCYRCYREAGWHQDPETAPLTLFDAITLLSLVREEAFDFRAVRVRMEPGGGLRLDEEGIPVTYAFSSDWSVLKPVVCGLLRG